MRLISAQAELGLKPLICLPFFHSAVLLELLECFMSQNSFVAQIPIGQGAERKQRMGMNANIRITLRIVGADIEILTRLCSVTMHHLGWLKHRLCPAIRTFHIGSFQ